MDNKKLVILRGNSGSGKSSVARALQRKIGRNTLLIPQDTVRREMLWVRDGADTLALPSASVGGVSFCPDQNRKTRGSRL